MNNHTRLDLDRKFPKLENPPIKEAVLEFQVSHEDGLHFDETFWEDEDINYFDLFSEKGLKYPKQDLIRDFFISAKVATSEVEVTNKSKGIQFSSTSPNKMTVFQSDKFVFRWQSKYASWDVFEKEGMKLWLIYKEVFKPQFIQRIGLRFINNLEVDSGIFEIDDYFTGASDITEQVGGLVNHFSTEEGVIFTDIPYQSVIRKKLIKEPQTSLIFDTDVFWVNELEPMDKDILHHINQMRSVKNHLFFNSITERVIQKYGVIKCP